MTKRAVAASLKKMDNEQDKNEKMLDKASILENESNAKSLGRTKVVYSRRGEEKDTLIVRDMYGDTCFDRFGVKGVTQLERVFYAIISVLSEHRTMLLKRMRYGGDALWNLLDGLSDNDRDEMKNALEAIAPTMKIELKKIETYPQLTLFQYNDDKTLKNGIYLYVGEAVKLVKHMNDLFTFSKSESLSTLKVTPIKKYENDDFF